MFRRILLDAREEEVFASFIVPVYPVGTDALQGLCAADDGNIGTSFGDGLAEKVETPVVFVTVIVASYFDIFQSEWFGMSVPGTHRSVDGIYRGVGIGDGMERILDQFVHFRDIFVTRTAILIGDSHVDDIYRLRFQIFAELKVFMEAHPVGCPVFPDGPEMLSVKETPYGLSESRIGTQIITFHKTSSRKTDEGRL